MPLRIRQSDTDGAIRASYTDDPSKSELVRSNPGKIFAVIGPFDGPSDRPDIQGALAILLRGANVTDA